MNTILSIILLLSCSINLAAQNYRTLTIEDWIENEWVNAHKIDSIYDSDNNLIQVLEQDWDGSAENWKNRNRLNYVNTTAGIITEINIEVWVESLNNWVDAVNYQYNYNVNNQIESITREMNIITNWQLWDKNTYHYDQSLHLIKLDTQKWDTTSNSWNNFYEENYTNYPNGIRQQTISKEWYEEISLWRNKNRQTYELNDLELISNIVTENFFDYWQNYSRDVIIYDGANRQSQIIKSFWIDSDSIWRDVQMTDYTYNQDGNIYQYVTKSINNPSTWRNVERGTWIYIGPNNINQTSNLFVNVFPNPCSEKLFLETNLSSTKEIKIYNIQGGLIYNQSFNGKNETININSLPPSLYILELRQGNNLHHIKFRKN